LRLNLKSPEGARVPKLAKLVFRSLRILFSGQSYDFIVLATKLTK